MTPNQQIFCNTPWYELHIYWDGSLGICCQESHKVYQDTENYNIATTTIEEWFNSDPVKQFRSAMLSNQKSSLCTLCYQEEKYQGMSRRIRSNQKSVIFTQVFDESFNQSPGYKHFEYSSHNQGTTITHPIDIHVDLGNFCNLACKMCNSNASSTIASQQVRWGRNDDKKYLGQDWTKNKSTWESFKKQLLEIPNLNNIHLMGGETLLTDQFEDLVDTMILNQRFDLSFSFVTNGTVYNPTLIEKLKKFQRVGIEISIETTDNHNSYIRQGTDTDIVLQNIKKYQQLTNGTTVTVTLRSAPNLLSIGYYTTLLEYAVDQQLLIKSNLCIRPRFLDAEILPKDIKLQYQKKFIDFIKNINHTQDNKDYNASDLSNYKSVVLHEAEMCLEILGAPTPADSEQNLQALVDHCKKWDQVYGLDAGVLYPELADIFKRHNYES